MLTAHAALRMNRSISSSSSHFPHPAHVTYSESCAAPSPSSRKSRAPATSARNANATAGDNAASKHRRAKDVRGEASSSSKLKARRQRRSRMLLSSLSSWEEVRRVMRSATVS